MASHYDLVKRLLVNMGLNDLTGASDETVARTRRGFIEHWEDYDATDVIPAREENKTYSIEFVHLGEIVAAIDFGKSGQLDFIELSRDSIPFNAVDRVCPLCRRGFETCADRDPAEPCPDCLRRESSRKSWNAVLTTLDTEQLKAGTSRIFQHIHQAVADLQAEGPEGAGIEDIRRVFKGAASALSALGTLRNNLRQAKGLPPIELPSGPEVRSGGSGNG